MLARPSDYLLKSFSVSFQIDIKFGSLFDLQEYIYYNDESKINLIDYGVLGFWGFGVLVKNFGYRHHVSVVRAFKHSESERIRAVQQERGHPRKMILWNFARRGLRLKTISKVVEFQGHKIVRLMGSTLYCRILAQKIQENRKLNFTNFIQVLIFSMSSNELIWP